MKENTSPKLRLKLGSSIITNMIEQGAKVLDLGCGNGNLLSELIKEKNIKGLGIEIDQDSVISALEKGLSIIQADIDEGLREFDDKQYDWVILNQTLQSTEKPDYVIDEMLRVGKKVVVSFPNFAYWKVRFHLFFTGHMPKSKLLPFEWYDTPNIHLLTANDFYAFCKKRDIENPKIRLYNKRKSKKEFFNQKAFQFLCRRSDFRNIKIKQI